VILLEDVGRDYQRFRHTPEEKINLVEQGLQHVLSSNVSAVGVSGDDLIIRFHNGSLYEYSNMANSFPKILKSNSKGKWVWKYLRRSNVPYRKIGTISLPDDLKMDDEELFKAIDNIYLRDLNKVIDTQVQVTPLTDGKQRIELGEVSVYQQPVIPKQKDDNVGYLKTINSVVEDGNILESAALGYLIFNVGGLNVYKPI
jgi:hypothetical protein